MSAAGTTVAGGAGIDGTGDTAVVVLTVVGCGGGGGVVGAVVGVVVGARWSAASSAPSAMMGAIGGT